MTGFRRSARLVQAFRVEQTQPEFFYELLANDSVAMISQHEQLSGRTVLDVGAGPAQFAERFSAAGAKYIAVDHDADALSPAGLPGTTALVADGLSLPIADGSVDIVFSSNVFEHVRNPLRLADEMSRVVRLGGLLVLTFTPWLSPWGGHETSPFHYLGGERAIRIYTRRYGHPPKNQVGRNLFRASVGSAMTWARREPDLTVLEARPRYYPLWLRGLAQVPGVREVLLWNLWLVCRKRP